MVIGIIGAASPVHVTGFSAAISDGLPIRLIAAPATLPLPQVVRRLNAARPPALLGYPSKLAELAREQRAGRLRIAPRSVTAMSELLTPRDRAAIAEAFGVPVIDQFASTEGLVGQSEPGGSVLRFASDLCLTELVDADNQPVPDGTTSAKVLVTNLHNLTQPLIRYELTDRFVRPPGSSHSGYLRARVEGRADEPFRYGRLEVHPHVLRSPLVAAAAVREYQVRQTERGVDVACVADGAVTAGELAARLEQGLRRAGLAQPRVCVRMVDAISRDPLTGKARRFIPNRPAPTARQMAS
jgi:phenylacetate-coenzyme A ligase PaaK-like adenylate-forming protein